jgi:hypothetical protein
MDRDSELFCADAALGAVAEDGAFHGIILSEFLDVPNSYY